MNSNLALWRFGIISPFLYQDPEGDSVSKRIFKASKHFFIKPDGTICSINPETIRQWLQKFNEHGISGLENKERTDLGETHVPEIIQEAIRKLHKEHPRWTLQAIFKELFEKKIWNGRTPARSSLYRFCYRENLQRDPHLDPSPCRSFEYSSFGQLWIADFKHGPKLWVEKDKRKTYLHAIIDDYSRYIVQAQFYLSEGFESMISDLKTGIRRFGIPQRFYSDNGSAYKCKFLKIIGANLRIHLPHTWPYKPQGRGKIERFFRTVQEQFLDVKNFKTFKEINSEFAVWVSEYNKTVHSALKTTPLEQRLSKESVCRSVPEINSSFDKLFLIPKRCRLNKDGTVIHAGIKYELLNCKKEPRALIYFDPMDKSQIWYGDEKKLAKPIDKNANARRFENIQYFERREKNDE